MICIFIFLIEKTQDQASLPIVWCWWQLWKSFW